MMLPANVLSYHTLHPITLCASSRATPHHAPRLIRLYIPSGSQTWEDPRDVLLHLGREIIYRDSPQMGQEAVRFHHLGGSVGPPAEWLGSKIGCVSLNQQAISGNAAGGPTLPPRWWKRTASWPVCGESR